MMSVTNIDDILETLRNVYHYSAEETKDLAFQRGVTDAEDEIIEQEDGQTYFCGFHAWRGKIDAKENPWSASWKPDPFCECGAKESEHENKTGKSLIPNSHCKRFQHQEGFDY